MTRLGIYTDYSYSISDGQAYAERAFALFIAALARKLDEVTVIGRVGPGARPRYPLGHVNLIPLPHYPSLVQTGAAVRGMAGSIKPFWRALDDLDCVWILGPHPLAFPFAFMARLRGRRVILGVRQDTVGYMRGRHPGSAVRIGLGRTMEAAFRFLARFWPVVVVGPALARAYSHGKEVLQISVSLVDEREICDRMSLDQRPYDGKLRALSVGRLEEEKNPLALADVLSELRRSDERWELTICGEGEMRPALERRLQHLGLADHVKFLGYVPHGETLSSVYRDAHALIHVSWTEGVPQVLYEAFAAALPVVATDVGGVSLAMGDAAILAPPGRPDLIAAAVAAVGKDRLLRESMVEAGLRNVRGHTIEAETTRVAQFIRAHA